MSAVNTATLLRLADKDTDKLVQDFGGLPLDIKEAIIKKQAESRQATVDAAAQEIVNLKQIKEAQLLLNAQRIQALNNEVAAITSQMGVIQDADRFGDSTSNYLPLAKTLNQGTPVGAKSELLSVPKDWKYVAPSTDSRS
jgi:hypothetical protein